MTKEQTKQISPPARPSRDDAGRADRTYEEGPILPGSQDRDNSRHVGTAGCPPGSAQTNSPCAPRPALIGKGGRISWVSFGAAGLIGLLLWLLLFKF